LKIASWVARDLVNEEVLRVLFKGCEICDHAKDDKTDDELKGDGFLSKNQSRIEPIRPQEKTIHKKAGHHLWK